MISNELMMIKFRIGINEQVNADFINKRISTFFEARGIKEYIAVDINNFLSEKEFMESKNTERLYKAIYRNISSYDVIPLCCPVWKKSAADQVCEASGIRFSEIIFGKVPLIYYIYFDIDELHDFVEKISKLDP